MPIKMVNTDLVEILNRDQATNHRMQLAQPGGSNLCGAYALATSLAAAGKLKDSRDKYKDIANNIYVKTGILDPQGGEVNADGYNSPAMMATIGREYKCLVTICALKNVVARLGQRYAKEKNRCDQFGFNKFDKFEEGEEKIQIICVNIAGSTTNMHWLARGFDGYYDPGTGSMFNAWASPGIASSRIGNYQFAGLWLTLS